MLESSEAPFLMSQLLSKLDPNDNSHFSEEMKEMGNKKPLANSSPGHIREQAFATEAKVAPSLRKGMKVAWTRVLKKTENNAANGEGTEDDACSLGCKTKHHLAACPTFQILTVNQKREIVNQHWRCRNSL